MDKLRWCIGQKGGIELIPENKNLSEEYFRKSENALRAVRALERNDEWQISAAYYSMYFSLYAVLMKVGIRCEIHACTIEVMRRALNQHFVKDDIELLQRSFAARIDSQYYTDREVKDEERLSMVQSASGFHLRCREVAIRLTSKDIRRIREIISRH